MCLKWIRTTNLIYPISLKKYLIIIIKYIFLLNYVLIIKIRKLKSSQNQIDSLKMWKARRFSIIFNPIHTLTYGTIVSRKDFSVFGSISESISSINLTLKVNYTELPV